MITCGTGWRIGLVGLQRKRFVSFRLVSCSRLDQRNKTLRDNIPIQIAHVIFTSENLGLGKPLSKGEHIESTSLPVVIHIANLTGHTARQDYRGGQ